MTDTIYQTYGSFAYQNDFIHYKSMMEELKSFLEYQNSVDSFWAYKYEAPSSEYLYIKRAMDRNNVANSQYHFYDSIEVVRKTALCGTV